MDLPIGGALQAGIGEFGLSPELSAVVGTLK